MKGKQFAKIFETENGQILITKDYCSIESKHQLIYTMDVGGAMISLKMASVLINETLAEEDIKERFNLCDSKKASEVSQFLFDKLLIANS